MILPATSVDAGPATATFADAASPSATSFLPGYGNENWSSLIGIVTAIVGNILISFALNTQRYAHIRLEREWQQKERERKRRSASYRSEQVKKADERPKADLSRNYHRPRHNQEDLPENGGETVHEAAIASESDPLIPIVKPSRSPRRAGSRPSLTTAAGSEAGNETAYKQKSYLKSPYWWAGIILMTCGEAGNFLAYGFAPASIVSPLGVVALISNCIIAPFMLKEPFRKRDALGVLVAVAGAVTVVLSANDNNPKLGPGDIWDLISTWEFETYLGITTAVILALMAASKKYGGKSILIDLGLVGLFGGYTALSTKGVASMLSYTLWRAITFPVTYLLVAILVGTAVMQIKYINRALQRFDATQVIPVQFVLFTLSVILGSAILYRDFERTSGSDAGKFFGGCALTFLGVWLITSARPPKRDTEEEDRDPEPEDAINLIDGERYHDELDGLVDEPGTSSRRSSTLRAISPPIDITRRPTIREISPPPTPNTAFTPNASTPPTPSTPHEAPEMPASLTTNRWDQESSAESPSIRERPADLSRHTTLSAPILPTEQARVSTSSPDLPTNLPMPHTPARNTSDTAVPTTPIAGNTLPPHLRRRGTGDRLGARNSLPGPLLASPLSTSLSAMVQDLKRGGSLRGHPTHRTEEVARRQSVLGIGAGETHEDQIGEPLDRRRTGNEETENERVGRGRSLSGTLHDLWRGFRGQQDAVDPESRAANGESG